MSQETELIKKLSIASDELVIEWHDGIFTGAVSAEIEAECKTKAISCVGKAGSACLMHSKLMHGSKSCLLYTSPSPRD